nr:hypothetical protein [Tanacetum cinerariifolium]
MPFSHTSNTRRRLRKPFTSSPSDHFPENIFAVEDTLPAGEGLPTAATTILAGSSIDPADQVAAAPSSTIPTADKGKAPMVDDSPPTDLLSEQERILKNLYDYQLGEELAKKLHVEQEVEFARQQEELAQKAQAERVASLAEQDWLELMAKIATNSALSKQLLGDDVNEENMNERLGMLLMRKRWELAERSWVKPMNKTQQRDYMRAFMKNQSASIYNQGWTMKQVPTRVPAALSITAAILVTAALLVAVAVSVPAAPSVVAAVLVPAAPSVVADVSVLAILPDLAHVDTKVHADEPNPDATPTDSKQVSAEHSVAASTPSSSRKHHKQIAKKRVTPIFDVVDDALIRFDSASESDDDCWE